MTNVQGRYPLFALSVNDAINRIRSHAQDRGHVIMNCYGPTYTLNGLHTLLQDREIVRYPVRMIFDGEMLQSGEPAFVMEIDDEEDRHSILSIHPALRNVVSAVSTVLFYQLARVNYGPYATAEHAEALGAAALGVSEDDYYDQMCAIADFIQEMQGSRPSMNSLGVSLRD